MKFLSALIVIAALTACVRVEESAIKTLCKDLPTVSTKDTTQTIIEVDNFNAKFEAAVGCK